MMPLYVKAESTPNPNAMKFTATETIFKDNERVIAKKGENPTHPLAREILNIDGVDNVFGYQDFLTVNKTFDASWDDVLPKVEAVFQNYDA